MNLDSYKYRQQFERKYGDNFKSWAKSNGYNDNEINSFVQSQWQPFAKQQAMADMQAKATQQPEKPKGNFLTSLIPTAGGIGGALAGGAAGAAAGSVVPVLGTAVGGLIGAILGGAGGSAVGKVGENAVEGEADLGKGVGKEALLGGVFSAPPVRLARGLMAAGKAGVATAKGVGEQTAKSAFDTAFTAPGALSGAGTTLRGEARGVGIGDKLSGSKIGPSKERALNGFLDNTVKLKGLTAAKQLDGIEKFIADRNGQLSQVISANNRALSPAEKTALSSNIEKTFGSTVIDPSSRQRGILDDIKTRIDQAKDVSELDGLRKVIDSNINFARNAASPEPAAEQIYKLARKSLTNDVAAKVGGAKSLKSDLSNALDAQELLLNKAGGGGGLARTGTSGIATIPIPRRGVQAIQTLAGRGLNVAGKQGGGFGVLPVAARQGVGRVIANPGGPDQTLQDPTLTQALTDPAQGLTDGSLGQSGSAPTAGTAGTGASNPFGFSLDQVAQGMSAAALSNDTKAYAQLSDLYDRISKYESDNNPAPKTLNATQIQQANNATSALADLSSVRDTIQSDPGAIWRAAVPGGSIARGLTGTTDYNAAKQNIVDVISRLRSGAAITADEAHRYMSLLPAPGDSQESALQKVDRLNALLSAFANPQSSSMDLSSVLSQMPQ